MKLSDMKVVQKKPDTEKLSITIWEGIEDVL